MFDCEHIDSWGFCKLLSDADVVVRCPENADCDQYLESEVAGDVDH